MSNEHEKQDNERYSKNFTRVPNILFASYKKLTKEEKFLYCTLRQVYWDMKPRFVSLRELSELTDFSRGALANMLPHLNDCGLIHAEIRREKDKDGNEKGNAKYHITIPDIWELNKQFFASSPDEQEQMDPSLKLVQQMDKIKTRPSNGQACPPNVPSLSTKSAKLGTPNGQVQAQVEHAKDIIKDISKESKKESPSVSPVAPDSPVAPSFAHSSHHIATADTGNETKNEDPVVVDPVAIRDTSPMPDLPSKSKQRHTEPLDPDELGIRRIDGYWQELGFSSRLPAAREHWRTLSKRIQSFQEMENLYHYARRRIRNDPAFDDKGVKPGNLANAEILDGWKQEREPLPDESKPIGKTKVKITPEYLASLPL